MKFTKTCLTCGKIFQIKKGSSHTGQYCSRKCYWGQKIIVQCLTCQKVFKTHPYRAKTVKYCSVQCQWKSKIGKPSWNKSIKTGLVPKTAFKKGHGHIPHKGSSYNYVLIHKPNHPFCNKQGYIQRSHLVVEKHLKRFLNPNEIVHHINGIKNDDRLKNLYLFKNSSEHSKYHYLFNKFPNLTLKSNLL